MTKYFVTIPGVCHRYPQEDFGPMLASQKAVADQKLVAVCNYLEQTAFEVTVTDDRNTWVFEFVPHMHPYTVSLKHLD